ncbi:cation-translocating P-type ATPase [Mycoplasma sp. P36-A1]|uniref:cation-translocating P-type ATPase n=1 Tax=Mycoplasma sp. P36-A1 TaxID=3252900 RepID=UPI003C2C832C
MNWYNKKIEQIISDVEGSPAGLNEKQIELNRIKYGKNELATKEEENTIQIIWNNIKEPLTLVLLGVIIICAAIGEWKEVIIITAIILINIVISTVQEKKSQNALNALEQMTNPKSTVIRSGKTLELESSELVVGDIILLEAGNFVPVDIRLIEVARLFVDEASLTGESTVVEKHADVISDPETSLGDRKNMLFGSTFITNGRAKGIVVEVGQTTEIGKIASMINEAPKLKTPLQERLAQLSTYVSIFAFIIAAIIMGISYFFNGINIADSFISAITLAVAVIPESLPVIVSITLALSVSKMATKNAIIKKLPAVESLGTVNIICTDKTGTLTINKMTVEEYFIGAYDIDATPLTLDDTLLQSMVLNNDSFTDAKKNPIGDPTELALTYFGNGYGIKELEYRDEHPRINEIPFDSERKLMTTVNQFDGRTIAFVKGAIDNILSRCVSIEEYTDNGVVVRDITEEDKKTIASHSLNMSDRALRVLAFAYRDAESVADDKLEHGLTFVGAVGMIDPERKEAKAAIAKAKRAGIKTIMITGDHPNTAFAIARKLEMVHDRSQVMTGKQLDHTSDEELAKIANNFCVYSRVSPEHKVRIVKALQSQGNIVSMTGDGVNDAPSLQTANIGVAMGITGTDVAKQASSMILMDDNFATIVYAVEEGRNIYNKIKKSVQFVLATNAGAVFAILIAVLMGLRQPLGAIHVLWVNLIVESLIAIPIGMDSNDPDVMKEKPRAKSETIFHGMWTNMITIALAVGGCVLAAYLIMNARGYNYLEASTVSFAIMATAPMLYVLAIRSQHKPVIFSKPWENMPLMYCVILGLLLNVALVYSPLNTFFNLTALVGFPLYLAIGLTILPLIIVEIVKGFQYISYKKSID